MTAFASSPATPVAQVRARIASVFALSDDTSLSNFIAARIPHLHYAINATRSEASLLAFVEGYILQVPDFIDALGTLGQAYGFYDEVERLINLAASYFLTPSPLIPEAHTRLGLLDESYLAHRLLEEINDRLMGVLGAPLLPMDNTTANLIAHDIIGEPFANELDQAAMSACDQVFNPALFKSQALAAFSASGERQHALERWPRLAEDLGITLSFASDRSQLQ